MLRAGPVAAQLRRRCEQPLLLPVRAGRRRRSTGRRCGPSPTQSRRSGLTGAPARAAAPTGLGWPPACRRHCASLGGATLATAVLEAAHHVARVAHHPDRSLWVVPAERSQRLEHRSDLHALVGGPGLAPAVARSLGHDPCPAAGPGVPEAGAVGVDGEGLGRRVHPSCVLPTPPPTVDPRPEAGRWAGVMVGTWTHALRWRLASDPRHRPHRDRRMARLLRRGGVHPWAAPSPLPADAAARTGP